MVCVHFGRWNPGLAVYAIVGRTFHSLEQPYVWAAFVREVEAPIENFQEGDAVAMILDLLSQVEAL